MSKIVTAISKIMADVGSVKKDGENKFHGYKYATASDILHKLQPLLAREGLVIFQNEVGRELIADGSILAVNYEFTLAHAGGDVWPDRPRYTGMAAAKNTKGGFDDKSANKCHTAARKYFMLALFQIPTGDYDDADEQEDRPAQRQPQSPIKPEKIEPPVNPETGEISPHKITAKDEMAWGGLFVAAIATARDEPEIEQWLADNAEALDRLESAAPKVHARVMSRVDEKRKSFNRKAA